MGVPSTLSKNYSEFGGLDLRSNDLTRKPRFARDCRNAEYLKNNSVTACKGHKGIAPSQGGGGTVTYVRDESGVKVEEVLTIDNNLWRRKESQFTVTYAGTGVATFSIVPELNGGIYSFYCNIAVDGVSALHFDLGTGIEEATPVTIAALVAQINAVTDFSVSFSPVSEATLTTLGLLLKPAAHLPLVDTAISGAYAFTWYYWELVYSDVSNPFQTFYNTFSTSAFEHASFLNTGNRLFFATGSNELYKYDGVTTFRAGMPQATAHVSTNSGNAGNPDGSYECFITYEQIDETGAVIEGDPSAPSALTIVTNQIHNVIPTIQATSGFNTSFARVNGVQTGTTITVDSGHTLQVGQTGYMVHDTTFVETEVKITAVAATTVTFASSVTVADNQIISANLRINLWRNRNGALDLPYLVRSFANDPSVFTFPWDDDVADGDLEIEYEYTVTNHGLPPANQKYLTSYKGLTVTAGQGDRAYYSDPDGPEYFATDFGCFFTLISKTNDPVRAVGSNREVLLVFKENETHSVNGTLHDGKFRQEILADAIGCSSHQSVKDVDGTLWFYSGEFGPRRIVGNSLPDDVSYRVLPAFSGPRSFVTPGLEINHRRVVAVDVKDLQLVVFYFPVESNNYPGASSFSLAADYRSQYEIESDYDEQGRVINQIPKIRWWAWNAQNFGGGATVFENTLIWTERRYDDASGALASVLCARLENDDEYDFTAHAQPYSWSYESSWDDAGEPDLLKKYIQASVVSFPDGTAPTADIEVSTEIDGVNGSTHSKKTINFTNTSATGGFGFPPFGAFPFGEPGKSRKIMKFRPTKSTSLKLVMTSEVWRNQPLVSGWTLQIVPTYRAKVAND